LEKKRAEHVLPGSRVGGKGPKQCIYIYVSKCKNNTIKGERKDG
jgi:hypothetical protein